MTNVMVKPIQDKPNEKKMKSLLLGLGLDNDGGQKRITKGKNFLLAGGSKTTHENMQEKAIKFNEELDKRKKRLDDIGPEEFFEIADQVDMHKSP